MLEPEQAFEFSWAFEFRDEDTLKRARLSRRWGSRCWSGPDREEELKDAIASGLAKHRTPEGGYQLDNEYHYLIARA